MKLWIIFVILYGILKGMREPIKKKALSKSSLLGTLFVYTFVGFLFALPALPVAFSLSTECFLLILLKSAVIFVAWIAAFASVKKLPVSLYGVVDMSRVIFSTLLGVICLGERLTFTGIISLILVLLGLYLVNLKRNSAKESYNMKYIWLTLFSCATNAISGTLDKYIMTNFDITGAVLQFWFMLLLSGLYGLYILVKREKVGIINCIKNPYIYLISFLLVIGDRMLFAANADPESRVTAMTLIKQSSVIVTILAGKFIYKEKNIMYKLMCAGIIIAGIFLSVI